MIYEGPNVAPGAVEPEPEAENTGADESGVQGQSQPDADGNSGITAASTEHHDDRHSVGGGNFETESSGEEPSDAGESGEQLEPAASNQPAREQEADANGTAARDETAKTADETTLGDCAPDDAGVASAEDAEAGAIASDQASECDLNGLPPLQESLLSLLGPVPTVVGEDRAQFARVLAALFGDQADSGVERVIRLWRSETAAWKMLTVRRGVAAERSAWNAEISELLYRGLLDLAAMEVLAELENDGEVRLKRDEAIEETFRQRWDS